MDKMRGMLAEKYDFVCSLGNDCGCAWHLARSRLRAASYPFDWIGTWHIGMVGVAELVAKDFEGFIRLENLQKAPSQPRGPLDDHKNDYYIHTGVRLDSAHDFPAGVPLEESYPAVRAKYDRRIARFYRTMRASRRVLLVWWTWRDHPEPDTAMKAAGILRKKFPGGRIDLLVMRHADVPEIRAEAVGDGVFVVDGPFHPVGGHPAFGDPGVTREVLSRIRLRGKRRRILREWFARVRLRLVSAFIFNREKRHAYRERHAV